MKPLSVVSSDCKRSKPNGSLLVKRVAGAFSGKVKRAIRKQVKELNQDVANEGLAGNKVMGADGKACRIDGAKRAVQFDRMKGARTRDEPRSQVTGRGSGRTRPRWKERPSRPAALPPP